MPDVDARILRLEQGTVTVLLLAGFVFPIPWMIPVAAALPGLDAALGRSGPTPVLWRAALAPRLGPPRAVDTAAGARAQALCVFGALVVATLLVLARPRVDRDGPRDPRRGPQRVVRDRALQPRCGARPRNQPSSPRWWPGTATPAVGLLAAEQAAVAALVEEQRPGVGGEPELVHPTDDDDVVAGVVLALDRAVQVRVHVVEDRAALARVPVDLTEPVRTLGREQPRDVLLVLVEHVDA